MKPSTNKCLQTLYVNFQVDPRDLPKQWSTISMDLRDVVRHEIEHLSQSGYNVVSAKEMEDNTGLRAMIKKPKWTDIHGHGWKLSQNGLSKNDKAINTYTERELQKFLGVKERSPEERK